jgi:hypothetical protein
LQENGVREGDLWEKRGGDGEAGDGKPPCSSQE